MSSQSIRLVLAKEFPHVRPVPGLSSVQKIAGRVRRSHDRILDGSWHLSTYATHQGLAGRLSTDAAGVLLDLWAANLAKGEDLTVRQAVWASRLLSILPGGETAEIGHWARRYAWRERAAEALGQEFDSTDLDAALIFFKDGSPWSWWQYRTTVATGMVPDTDLVRTLKDLGSVDPQKAAVEWRIPQWSVTTASERIERIVGLRERTDLCSQMTSFGREWRVERTERQPYRVDGSERTRLRLKAIDAVYALWLRAVSATQNWQTMSEDDRWLTAERLGHAVMARAEELDRLISQGTSPLGEWEPTEILRDVGYERHPQGFERSKRKR